MPVCAERDSASYFTRFFTSFFIIFIYHLHFASFFILHSSSSFFIRFLHSLSFHHSSAQFAFSNGNVVDVQSFEPISRQLSTDGDVYIAPISPWWDCELCSLPVGTFTDCTNGFWTKSDTRRFNLVDILSPTTTTTVSASGCCAVLLIGTFGCGVSEALPVRLDGEYGVTGTFGFLETFLDGFMGSESLGASGNCSSRTVSVTSEVFVFLVARILMRFDRSINLEGSDDIRVGSMHSVLKRHAGSELVDIGEGEVEGGFHGDGSTDGPPPGARVAPPLCARATCSSCRCRCERIFGFSSWRGASRSRCLCSWGCLWCSLNIFVQETCFVGHCSIN